MNVVRSSIRYTSGTSSIFRGPSALDERRLLGSTSFLFNSSVVISKGKGCIGKAANTSHSNLPKMRTLIALLARSSNSSFMSNRLTSDSTATFDSFNLCGGLSRAKYNRLCKGAVLPSTIRHYSIDRTWSMVKLDGVGTGRSFFHSACLVRAPSSKYVTTFEEVTYRPQTGVFLPSPMSRPLIVVAHALQDLQERNDHLLSPDVVFHARNAVSAARTSAFAFYSTAEPEVVKTIKYALTEMEPSEDEDIIEYRLYVARELSKFLGEPVIMKLPRSYYDSDEYDGDD